MEGVQPFEVSGGFAASLTEQQDKQQPCSQGAGLQSRLVLPFLTVQLMVGSETLTLGAAFHSAELQES